MPGDDSVFSVIGRNIEFIYQASKNDVLHGDQKDADLITILNLAAIALFSEYKMHEVVTII